MLTHTHMFVSSSSKHLACDLKAVFGAFFPPPHNTGYKTVMLQNDIVQIRAKLLLHTIRIIFSTPPSSLGGTCNICWCVFVQPPVSSLRGSRGAWLLPSSPRCSCTDLSSGDGCRSWNFICAWCWSRRCSVKWGFPRVMLPWVSDFSSLWALCKLMDAKGVLSAVGIGQGEEQRGWFQGCTHLLPPCHAHNRAAGAFWHFGFFSVQLLNPRFCFVHYCSFTFHCNYLLPVTKIGSLEKILSRFRKDEQIVVLEVVSSLKLHSGSDGADEPLCGSSEPSVKITCVSRIHGRSQASPLENKPDKRASVRFWGLKDLLN